MGEPDFEKVAERLIKQYVLDEYSINYSAIAAHLAKLYESAWEEGYDAAVRNRDD